RPGLDPRRDPVPGPTRTVRLTSQPKKHDSIVTRWRFPPNPFPGSTMGASQDQSNRSSPPVSAAGEGRVFERFTERARQVAVLAQDEARALKHNYIGTEHILLGLLREEEGLAARVLESLDITVE